jgi:SAM-dependent methyltransferase
MKALLPLLSGCLLVMSGCRKPPASAAQSPAPTPEATPAEAPSYSFSAATPDGIGKYFHGREISHVMGHPAIGWLERDEREAEEAPSKAIAALKLAPDAVIADIGAGSGYYSFRIASQVPSGRVVAVDIQPEMIEFLSNKAKGSGVANVQPHLGAEDDIKLPAGSLDAALLVDAYHEFSHPAEMLASLRRALKAGGRLYLIEFRAEDPNVPIKELHKMSEAQARLEVEGAGFKFISNLDVLPWQHLLIFENP